MTPRAPPSRPAACTAMRWAAPPPPAIRAPTRMAPSASPRTPSTKRATCRRWPTSSSGPTCSPSRSPRYSCWWRPSGPSTSLGGPATELPPGRRRPSTAAPPRRPRSPRRRWGARADAQRGQPRPDRLLAIPEQRGGAGIRLHGDHRGRRRGGGRTGADDPRLPDRPRAGRGRPRRDEPVPQQGAATLAILVLVLPLTGSVLCGFAGPLAGRRFVNLAGTVSIAAAFAVTLVMLAQVIGASPGHAAVTSTLWTWLDLGRGNLTVLLDVTVDPLSVLMLLVITGVGLLIHVYSVGYMEHDPGVARFFSYMNFFIFAMSLLVLAANLIILIIGWAAVALASYLLIGFWYERPSAVAAARKAFITQVIGDVALVIAAFLIFLNLTGSGGAHLYTLDLPQIFTHASSLGSGSPLLTLICILLAIGAFAKSAQFPLHTWLPDAMEGPTPVSALIHAATMVTAGVYLIARFHPLFDRAPVAQGMVACVGIGTALMAGVIALSQVDIKRVIAYSTMSQIGLMIFAVGIGAYSAAMYHFAAHAIFKALLFMGAGNVIHAMDDAQDIRLMGGLGARMRRTEVCFLSGTFALAGIPLFIGFFSKEGLLGFGLTNGPGVAPWLLYIVGISVNLL